ncbi:MAG TPA: hypothetical protein HA257_06895 [Candidatus Methanoperedenaceae archaeon]|nr:hypothetical protein [Candidatus Methanoperedenaceae archaeon]
MKIDAFGDIQWKQKFNGYRASHVSLTRDGGYVVAGSSYPLILWEFRFGDINAWIIRTDADGNEVWSMMQDENNHIASSIFQTSDGGYLITGNPVKYSMGGKADAWLMKLSAENQVIKVPAFEAHLAAAVLSMAAIWKRKQIKLCN